MSPKKPGIFDPWRQQAQPPPVAAKPPASDEDRKFEERCVTYAGRRAGLNVWVDATSQQPELDALEAVRSLLTQLRELRDPGVTDALKAYGFEGELSTADAEKPAMAIRRALVLSPKAAALIAQKRVKAFVQ